MNPWHAALRIKGSQVREGATLSEARRACVKQQTASNPYATQSHVRNHVQADDGPRKGGQHLPVDGGRF